ncbi:aminodeoxychorismate/anthranilate synthase component II [Planococcus sp. N028]|uniref:Aminodeoxychorismate/anthranilate synthase component II n=1 Tax=Planococcus shixiaomingii TaxID=3058393 RepID=A0ABT8N0W1_9BACL|nr:MULTISPECIES: aminodeoxychorismate/anthranilate synthase component II [unclassified Planococcus (in: firmicutes)]MDN7241312.1 aminodeoxychorismate/anthranilate synthase component II [Planococcus sp. N028]WKA53568.1 aminodeoxychorismate/anthranilate synthase component II [Planococcus sp. N022]
MIVIIDNQDSFTYNLVQYFLQIDPAVLVFQDGEITISDIEKLSPDLLVLSPGPGKPRQSEILRTLGGKIPVLGVCLGHQTIIEHFGGKVIKGQQPVHGKLSLVSHDGSGVFAGVPNPTPVVRYHSLVADEEAMPAALLVTARSEDGSIMAVQHPTLPIAGIQFHPESILTQDGFLMLKNAYEQALEWQQKVNGGTIHDETISSI